MRTSDLFALQNTLWKIGSLQISNFYSPQKTSYGTLCDTIIRLAATIFAAFTAYNFFYPCLPFVVSGLLQGVLLAWITLLVCSLLLKGLHQYFKPHSQRSLLSEIETGVTNKSSESFNADFRKLLESKR